MVRRAPDGTRYLYVLSSESGPATYAAANGRIYSLLVSNPSAGEHQALKIFRLAHSISGAPLGYEASNATSWAAPYDPIDVRAFPNEQPPVYFVLAGSAIYRLEGAPDDNSPETQGVLGSSPWEPGAVCAGNRAFDVAGSKIFVSNRCGAVEVYNKNFQQPSMNGMVELLFAGPELNGFQAWQDGPAGIRAFQRSNGEYLVNTVDSSFRAHNIVFRWHP